MCWAGGEENLTCRVGSCWAGSEGGGSDERALEAGEDGGEAAGGGHTA